MTPRDPHFIAADKAEAAITAIITARAFQGCDPVRQDALLIQAEEALYAALDLISQARPTIGSRFFAMAADITGSTPPASQTQLERAA